MLPIYTALKIGALFCCRISIRPCDRKHSHFEKFFGKNFWKRLLNIMPAVRKNLGKPMGPLAQQGVGGQGPKRRLQTIRSLTRLFRPFVWT
jgi:hypothetical protein